MPDHLTLFVQRAMDGFETTDKDPCKLIECVTCGWFTSYVEHLWTSNKMPEQERSAFFQVGAHARLAHRGLARIVRGWKA